MEPAKPGPGFREGLASRIGTRWMIAVPIVLVLVGSVAAFARFDRAHATLARHAARLPDERAALQALLPGRPALVEPVAAGNAREVVARFLAAFVAVPEAERTKVTAYGASRGGPKEIDAVLAAHAQVLAALEPILAVPAIPPTSVDLSAPDGWYMPRFNATRWLTTAGERALARGDADETARIALLAVALGHEFARDGTTIAGIYGLAVELVGTRRLADALGLGLGEARVREAGRVLRALEASRTSGALFVAGERASGRYWLATRPAESISMLGIEVGHEHLWSPEIYAAETLGAWDAAVDAAAAAAAGAETDAPAAIARVKAATASDHALLSGLIAHHSHRVERRETVRAWALVVATACAVAEAAARTSSLPETLEELVPEFLPAVPIDPWSGKPLRYEDGRIWSFGPNGTDDGGTPVSADVGGDPADLAVRVRAPR